MSPGEEPPFHVHQSEDEWFYLLDGKVTFHVGGENYPSAAGAFVSFSAPHPPHVHRRIAFCPFSGLEYACGFEHMFELAPQTPEDAARALQAYGMDAFGGKPSNECCRLVYRPLLVAERSRAEGSDPGILEAGVSLSARVATG